MNFRNWRKAERNLPTTGQGRGICRDSLRRLAVNFCLTKKSTFRKLNISHNPSTPKPLYLRIPFLNVLKNAGSHISFWSLPMKHEAVWNEISDKGFTELQQRLPMANFWLPKCSLQAELWLHLLLVSGPKVSFQPYPLTLIMNVEGW